jgi:hypothetical protein
MDLSTWGYESGSPANKTETVKEYSNEELFEIYCEDNQVPDVIMNYVSELEKQIRELTKKLKDYEKHTH